MNELKIYYKDEHIIVVEKPGGELSVPGKGEWRDRCLQYRIRQAFPECIEHPSVHRLDMYTSGLMIFALTKESQRKLSIDFQEKRVQKEYTALLEGIIIEDSGEIRLPFRLDVDNRPLQIYDPVNGKMGVTLWEKISVESNFTRVLFKPLTGRTHQLRVHSAHELGLGTPIVGDSFYGSGNDGDMMCLHASRLEFDHPVTGERMNFVSEVPF